MLHISFIHAPGRNVTESTTFVSMQRMEIRPYTAKRIIKKKKNKIKSDQAWYSRTDEKNKAKGKSLDYHIYNL